MISGVYAIEIADKIYIGSTKDFRLRWHLHLYDLKSNRHHNVHLQRMWNKYQEVVFSIICCCPISYLIGMEQYHIDKHWDGNKKCMNIAPVAGRTEGVKRPDLSLRNISNRGRKASEEVKQKMSESRKGLNTWTKGTKASEETRKKLSEAGKGRRWSEESKKKVSESKKGVVFSEETRRRMSESAKNKPPISEETRKKMSDGRKGDLNSTATITWEIAIAIREDAKSGMTHKAICEKYHVSKYVVQGITINRTWKV